MGGLEGFLATWSKARDTFGEGTPPTGERFDRSSQLRSLQTTVESAASGSRWSGAAATAYDKANSDHAKVFGDLATLDQRFGAKVTQSGDIVRAGRQNLDSLKQWVLDAAATVPAGKNRDALMLPIISKGLGQLQDIVKDSNGQLNGVANDIKTLGGEYDKLGKQKFRPEEGPNPKKVKGDEEDEEKKKKKKDDDQRGEGKKDDEKKKHGGEKSIGKGSKTQIEVSGDPQRKWGTPTDSREIWPNNPGRTGKFDGDNGTWKWQGPGAKGEAYASEHSDGKTGKAAVDAWLAKGEASYQRDVFGHPVTATAEAEVGAHANAEGTITNHGASAHLDAFAGGEVTAKVQTSLGPVDLSVGLTAQAGAGVNAGFDFGMQDGKFVVGGDLGAAWGYGGKIAPHIAIDPKVVTDGLHKAGKWLGGLFH